MNKDVLTYMGNHWVVVDSDVVTVGLNDEGVIYADSASNVILPEENSEVEGDEVCGEIETDDGPINLYAPIDGTIIEINSAVVESPDLITEDPYGEGWLFKIEAKDQEALNRLSVDLQKDE